MIMFLSRVVIYTTLSLTLSGCTLFNPPKAGQSIDQITSTLGKPSYTWQDQQDTVYEYSGGAFGQYTYMARFHDGKLSSYEQVWTTPNFNKIVPQQWNQAQVIRLVGHPTEIRHYGNTTDIAWNYGYKESNVWNSMISIYFNDKGIVTKVENGPDPRFEERDGKFPFLR